MVCATINIYAQQEKNVTITVYHSGSQTADGSIIPWTLVRNKTIRWCAVSPNLLKKHGGPYEYGDTITVTCGDPRIDGDWVIHDRTSSRHKNWIDILTSPSIIKTGKFHGKAKLKNKKKR